MATSRSWPDPFFLNQLLIRQGCNLLTTEQDHHREGTMVVYLDGARGRHEVWVPHSLTREERIKLILVHIKLATSYSRAEARRGT